MINIIITGAGLALGIFMVSLVTWALITFIVWPFELKRELKREITYRKEWAERAQEARSFIRKEGLNHKFDNRQGN